MRGLRRGSLALYGPGGGGRNYAGRGLVLSGSERCGMDEEPTQYWGEDGWEGAGLVSGWTDLLSVGIPDADLKQVRWVLLRAFGNCVTRVMGKREREDQDWWKEIRKGF